MIIARPVKRWKQSNTLFDFLTLRNVAALRNQCLIMCKKARFTCVFAQKPHIHIHTNMLLITHLQHWHEFCIFIYV